MMMEFVVTVITHSKVGPLCVSCQPGNIRRILGLGGTTVVGIFDFQLLRFEELEDVSHCH